MLPTYRTQSMDALRDERPVPVTSPTYPDDLQRRPNRTPSEKFRAAVHKAIVLQRAEAAFYQGLGNHGEIPGAEPGLDPRKSTVDVQFGGVHQDCTVEINDYSFVRSSFGKMKNKEFISYLSSPAASKRESWVKVRWINIAGLSWDVMKAVALRYDLHPLAIEDVFQSRQRTRSKADYYPQHLFLHVLCHELQQEDDVLQANETDAYDSPLADPEEDDGSIVGPMSRHRGGPLLPHHYYDLKKISPLYLANRLSDPAGYRRRKEIKQEEAALAILKKGERVHVRVTSMYIFLLRDGTVISIHNTPVGHTDFTSSITERLRHVNAVLRATADPSMLVHALLDLIVDNALEVIDEYQQKIDQFERQIMTTSRNMNVVRDLHILSGDLILHQRTLHPIKTLIHGLRRYDLDRVAAAYEGEELQNGMLYGWMSNRSKVYLADVFDHIDYILRSLETVDQIAENLISYAFNMNSYHTNDTIRRLTQITITCNPLIILTTYFGMNFDPMPAVQQHSDLLFWEIAIPLMAVLVTLFMTSDIRNAVYYLRTRTLTKKAVRTIMRWQR